jgi:TP901 family phage tail tape measure protein
MGITAADVYARLVLDDKEAKGQLGKFGTGPEANAAGGRLGKTVGAGFSKGLGAVGAGSGVLLVGAIEAASSFEQQLATIKTVATDLSDVELAKIGDDIQAVARETGKTTDDLTAGFYDLVSAGVPAADAIGVLRDSAKFATGALGSTAESVDLVTSVMNAYGLAASDSTRITDIFAKSVADGKVTAAELGSSIAQVAPIAASSGIAIEEVAAGFADLTAKGVPASQAATQMRSAISSLLTPNEQLAEASRRLNINFADLAKEKGLGVALNTLREDFTKSQEVIDSLSSGTLEEFGENLDANAKQLGLTTEQVDALIKVAGDKGLGAAIQSLNTNVQHGDEAFGKALGSIESYNFALAVTGENSEAFQEQITAQGEATGLAAKQYEIASDTTEGRAKRFAATIKTTLADVGAAALPVGGLLTTLNQLGPAMGNLLSPAKLLGGAAGGLAGGFTKVLIPAIAGILPAVTPAVTALGSGMAALIPIGMAALPFLLVGVLIAAIVFLANNPEIVDSIITFAEGAVQFLVDGFGMLIEALPGVFLAAFDAVMAAIPVILSGIVGLIMQLPGMLVELVPKIVGLWVLIASKIGGIVLSLVGRVVGFILSLPGKIVELLPKLAAFFRTIQVRLGLIVLNLIDKAVRFFLSLPGKIVGLLGTLGTFFGNIGRDLMGKVQTFIGSIVRFFLGIPGRIASIGGRIVSGIIGGMASLPGRLADVIRRAFANLRIDIGPFHISASGVTIDLPQISIPSFDVGTGFVPADMLAMVHQGEMIIPAAQAAAIRSGQLNLGSAMAVDPVEGGSGGGGDVIVPVTGFLRAEGPADVARHLGQLTNAGVIESRRQRSRVRVPEARRGGLPA